MKDPGPDMTLGVALAALGVLQAAAAMPHTAEVDPALAAYVPAESVSGEIVCAGNHATDDVVAAWGRKFATFHPGCRLKLREDSQLTSTAFEVVAKDSGIDLTPCAREPFPGELKRFVERYGGLPLVVAVATGSYATKSGTHALAFYVHADNPLSRLTVEQAREIYIKDGTITKWGDLGLTGEWADKPIHVFSLLLFRPNGSPLGMVNYFQWRILGREAAEFRRSLYQVDDNGPGLEHHMLTNIVRQVAADRYAIGYSGFAFRQPGTKTLALAETAAGPFYEGTHDEVARRVYPLSRTIYLAVNAPRDRPLKPAVREFLRFVLSRNGQQVLAEGTEKYLPLTPEYAAAERAKLK
jgi:phosphate transport system substrate-binding protein